MSEPKTVTTSTNDKCPNCHLGLLSKRHGSYHSTFHDGETERPLTVSNLEWLECSNCGESFLDNSAMERLDQAKYETLGLLSPLEILALRQKFGKSQEQMADLLRIGRKTYCRWENGTFFQTRANDNYLRLVLWLTKNVSDPVSVLQGLDNPNRQSRGHTFFIATREAYFEPNILLHRRGRCCLQAEETVV